MAILESWDKLGRPIYAGNGGIKKFDALAHGHPIYDQPDALNRMKIAEGENQPLLVGDPDGHLPVMLQNARQKGMALASDLHALGRAMANDATYIVRDFGRDERIVINKPQTKNDKHELKEHFSNGWRGQRIYSGGGNWIAVLDSNGRLYEEFLYVRARLGKVKEDTVAVVGERDDCSAGMRTFDLLVNNAVEPINDEFKIEVWQLQPGGNSNYIVSEHVAKIPYTGLPNIKYKDLDTLLSASIGIVTDDLRSRLIPVYENREVVLI